MILSDSKEGNSRETKYVKRWDWTCHECAAENSQTVCYTVRWDIPVPMELEHEYLPLTISKKDFLDGTMGDSDAIKKYEKKT